MEHHGLVFAEGKNESKNRNDTTNIIVRNTELRSHFSLELEIYWNIAFDRG